MNRLSNPTPFAERRLKLRNHILSASLFYELTGIMKQTIYNF